MSCLKIISNNFRILALAAAIVGALLLVVLPAPAVESAHSNPWAEFLPLSHPSGLPRTANDDDTAFREDAAGFAAYIQVLQSDSDQSEPLLDVLKIKENLETVPEESSIRGSGTVLDWGLNFGIVELPMFAAAIGPAPVENVTAYFDDQGWIVAYLPKDRPAVAMWKHDPTDHASNDPEADRYLENNLLVLAISEVLLAHDNQTPAAAHSDIGYYDWSNPECDAFILFSSSTRGGASEPVRFVIPHTIDDVRASAAALLTRQQDGGANTVSEVLVDGSSVVSADAGEPLNAANFELGREVGVTSLHRMVVDVNADEPGVGVIMLLYDKP